MFILMIMVDVSLEIPARHQRIVFILCRYSVKYPHYL